MILKGDRAAPPPVRHEAPVAQERRGKPGRKPFGARREDKPFEKKFGKSGKPPKKKWQEPGDRPLKRPAGKPPRKRD